MCYICHTRLPRLLSVSSKEVPKTINNNQAISKFQFLKFQKSFESEIWLLRFVWDLYIVIWLFFCSLANRSLGGRRGWRQISMALWRPGRHTCYNGQYKGLLNRKMELIPKSWSQFGLESATRLHEAGITSNRESAMSRWIRSRILYSPPVTSREPATPEGPVSKQEQRWGWW